MHSGRGRVSITPDGGESMLSARKIHRISLTEQEKQQLESLVRKGSINARVITRARVLLMAHDGKIDKEIYQALSLAESTPYDIRKRYTEGGLQKALFDAPRPGQKRKLSGTQEAEVVAIACTKAPKGYSRWTLDLLTEEVNNKLGVTIGRTAIWKVLLRNDTKPWLKKTWCIPTINPEFKKKMLDVLEVYERRYNREKPVVCLDEKSKQLLKDTRMPIIGRPGKPKRSDYEYERNGTCNLFVAVEPKAGRRTVRVTRRRTSKDYAYFVQYLVKHIYRNAKKIVLVEDNLNTHNKEALIVVFGEREGRKIAKKIEWHYTPKHASWIDQAEIEIHALEKQCLTRRIPDFHTMQSEVAACVRKRNKDKCRINWQFTREKAKQKFRLS